VHIGSEEGIFNFTNAALAHSDHIIVPFHCYQPLYQIVQSIGCSLTKWALKEELSWEQDLDFLKQNISFNTNVIVLNHLHNPIGYLPKPDQLQQIVQMA
jgi:aspartate/methionine/tyrosine aminotransferase